MPSLARTKPYLFYALPFFAFLFAIAPQDSSNPLMVVPFLLLSVYLLLSGRLSNIRLNDPVCLCLLLVWLGWTWGAAWSTVPFASQVTWVILSILPVTYLCPINRDIRPLLYALCAIVTLLAASTFYYMFVMEDHYWRARLFFEDENILGALIAMTIPLTISFYFTATQKKWKILICIGIALLLGGLILTQSRSALIGCIIGIIPVFLKNRQIFSKNSLKFILPLMCIFIAGLFASGVAHRLWLAIHLDKDVLGRLYLWKAALQMSWQHPLTGVGLGIFHLYYPPLKTISDNSTGFWVHMDPLQWTVETGWGTALALYALAATLAYKYIKHDLTQLQIGAGASLLAIFVTSHACYPFHYVPILILTGLLLAQFAPNYVETNRLRYVVAISLTLVSLCGFKILLSVTPTLYMWTMGVDGLNRQDIPFFNKYMQTCITKGDPRFPGCRIEAARFIIESSSSPSPEALAWLDEADRFDPVERSTHFYRAVYFLKTQPDKPQLSIESLNKALAIDPSYWNARKMLVQLLQQQGKNRQAFDTLEEARKYQISGKFLEEFYSLETDLYKKVNP